MPGLLSVSAPDPASPATRTDVGRVEFIALVLILLIFSEGLLPRLIADESDIDGSPLLRFLWLPVYAVALGGLLWQARAVAQVCLRLPFLVLLLGVCMASFLWSIDPALTQRRSLAIVMTSAAGLFIGTRYRWQTLLRAFAVAWLIVGLASLVTAIAFPAFGRMQEVHIGAWQGLYFEKNQLGGHMARAAVFAAILIIMDRPYRACWIAMAVLCAALVLLSTSKSALLGLLVGLAIILVGAWMKRGIRTGLVTLWGGAVLAGLAAAVLVFAPDIVLQLLGRDATLTGRTDIWLTLTDYIEQRPVFGYGYGAFWGPDSDPGNWVRETLQWDAPTAHNGWLEVAIALGSVGLALLVLDFLVTLTRALLAAIDTWTGLFALAFCVQFFLFSLSESTSLQQNSIVWVIYVAVAAKLAMRPKRPGYSSSVRRPAPVRMVSAAQA